MNPVMQEVCPNGLHTLVNLARDVLCIFLICLVHLILNVPVNNFTVMLGRGHRFLGILQLESDNMPIKYVILLISSNTWISWVDS